jgi:hypothetical protein
VYGKPVKYSMKLAHTRAGSTMLELIQPLVGESIYKDFLMERGEGFHHIACYEVDDIEEATSKLCDLGIPVIQSGRWEGAYFTYMGTEKLLGGIIEFVKRSTSFPEPEETYP